MYAELYLLFTTEIVLFHDTVKPEERSPPEYPNENETTLFTLIDRPLPIESDALLKLEYFVVFLTFS